MSDSTAMSGGPNSAVASGPSVGEQSGPGASQRVTGDALSGAAGRPEGGSATGNQTTGGSSPQNVGLAKVFQGGPGAGGERVTGSDTATGQPDPAGQPKGNPRPTQSNDSLPQWTQQLPKKMIADPSSAAHLGAFKTLDEFVQAHLDAQAKSGDGQSLALPGQGATSQEIQAFYERLGKPKGAESYAFAKSDPDFAKVAFDANLTGAQAEALYKMSLSQLDDAQKLVNVQLAQDFEASDVLLQKEFGDKYNEAIALMQRGLGNNPSTGQLSPIAQSLIDAGLAGKPEIVRAFIELGRATSEGAAAGGSFRAGQPGSVLEGRGFEYKQNYSKE